MFKIKCFNSPTYLWALVNNLKEFLKDKNFVEKAKEIKTQIHPLNWILKNGQPQFLMHKENLKMLQKILEISKSI